MTFITVKEASEKWNISTRRVCVLCSNGQVPGAVKKSKVWMIPAGAKKPEDGRKTNQTFEREPIILLFNPTYFDVNEALTPTREEFIICEAQKLLYSGYFEQALDTVNRLNDKTYNPRYTFVASVLRLAIYADNGSRENYLSTLQNIKKLIEAKDKCDNETILYYLFNGLNLEGAIQTTLSAENYVEIMPVISLVNAKKDINEMIKFKGDSGIVNHEIICRELEEKNCPLISAYYHIYLAVYYNAMSKNELFEMHIKKAAQILIPRKWYTPLAEYSATINLKFINEMDSDAYRCIDALSDAVLDNYVKSGILVSLCGQPQMETDISIRIGFKIIQGKNNAEIAEELGISQYKVRQHIEDILTILGATSKKEIKEHILANFFV